MTLNEAIKRFGDLPIIVTGTENRGLCFIPHYLKIKYDNAFKELGEEEFLTFTLTQVDTILLLVSENDVDFPMWMSSLKRFNEITIWYDKQE